MKKLRNAAAVAAIVAMGATQATAYITLPIVVASVVLAGSQGGVAAALGYVSGEAARQTIRDAAAGCSAHGAKVGDTCNFYVDDCENTNQTLRVDSAREIGEVSSVTTGGGTTVITDEVEVVYTVVTQCKDWYPITCINHTTICQPVLVWFPGEFSATVTGTVITREYGDPPSFNFNFGNSGSTCSYCTGDDKDG